MMVQEMTVQERINRYLSKLEKSLSRLPKSEKEDVLMEIKSHLYESISGEESGKAERLEAVIARLGEPEEYAKMIIEQHIGQVMEKGTVGDNLRLFLRQMLVPFLVTAAVFIALFVGNTYFLYSGLAEEKVITYSQLYTLMLYILPSTFGLILPMCVLYSTPGIFYTMVRAGDMKKNIKSPKIWLIVIMTGLLFSIASFIVGETMVPNSNRVSVDIIRQITDEKYEEINKAGYRLSIQEMNFLDAGRYLKETTAKGNELRTMQFHYYTKFSLPLACLACAFFGAFIGCILLSDLFHKGLVIKTMGFIIPIYIWNYTHFSLLFSEKFGPLSAFIPDLVIGGFGILMMAAVFLKSERADSLGR